MRVRYAFSFATSLALTASIAQSSNALDFDGVDDNAGSWISGTQLNVEQVSLTCWVKPLNYSPVYPDYDGIWGLSYNPEFEFYLIQTSPANRVEGHFMGDDQIDHMVAFDGLQVGVWQHLALVNTNTTLILYYNGDSVASAPSSYFLTWGGNYPVPFLGRVKTDSTDYFLKGQIDEATFWLSRLSGSEVNCIYHNGVIPSSPGLWWDFKMDQGVVGGDNTPLNNQLVNATGGVGALLEGFA